MVYDVAKKETFAALDSWLNELRENAGDSVKSIMVLENKIDQLPIRLTGKEPRASSYVQEEDARAYCEKNGLLFAKTSAKRNDTSFKWEGTQVGEAVKQLVLTVHASDRSGDTSEHSAFRLVEMPSDSFSSVGGCGCN